MDIFTAILYDVYAAVSISYIIHLGFYMVGASIYDIWQFVRGMRLQNDDSTDYEPLVTILVPAHNEEKVVTRSLESIAASTYQHKEIIVIDDASTDHTYKVLTDYANGHPEAPIRILRNETNTGKGGALNHALKDYASGELVMTLDADSVISQYAIEHAVSYFRNPKIVGVAANVKVMNRHTILSLLQKYEHMIGYRSKKAYSIANCEFVIGGVASTYRMETLRGVGFYDTDTLTEDIGLSMKIVANGNKDQRIVYGVDVMAMTEPVESFRALYRQRYRWKYGGLQNIAKHKDLIDYVNPQFSTALTQYRLPFAIISEAALLLLPFMWGYTIYLILVQHSLLLAIGSYATVTLYLLLVIWQDEHTRLRERLVLTLYLPSAYFIFYIMDIIQILAVVKCILHMQLIVRRKNIGSKWVSPNRIGSEMKIEDVILEQR